MEIAKEKFIETFKRECEKAIEDIKLEFFRISGTDEEPIIEIISNKEVSFCAMRNYKNDGQNTLVCFGKIIFGGFVDYKSIELTNEEFDDLYKFHNESETKARLVAKNKIISDGEAVLEKIVN